MHFSQNEALCKAFISKEYTPSDVQLLYNFVVNGTLNEGYVYDLETLRNYKKIMYEKNLELVKADFVSREKLLDAIFKLLCNKTYEEMTVEELQAAIIEKMAKNGPVTDQMKKTVFENIWHDSLVNWVKSFH